MNRLLQRALFGRKVFFCGAFGRTMLLCAVACWLAYVPHGLAQPERLLLTMSKPNNPADLTDLAHFKQWQQQARRHYRQALLWQDFPPVQATLLASQSHAAAGAAGPDTTASSYRIEHYRLQLTSQTATQAYLLVPKHSRGGVLLLHDHGAEFSIGKEKWLRQAPFATSEQQEKAHAWQQRYFQGHAIANELAAQGYTVLVADSIGFSSHHPLAYSDQQQLASHLLASGHSLAGLAAAEDLQLATFLRQQIGEKKPLVSIGFSMGAFRAWQVAALSTDVDAAAAVCWFGRWQDLTIAGGNLDKGQTAFYFLHPGLNQQFDLPDLLSLIAPRPLYLINGAQDRLFDVQSVQAGYHQLAPAWQLFQASNALTTELWSEATHEFNERQQHQVWQWLAQVTSGQRL